MSDVTSRNASDWATANGDIWAERWPETDRALAGLSPHLLSAVLHAAPAEGFRAFEVGCGAGSTSLALAEARPDAAIIACDLSPALSRLAKERTVGRPGVRVVTGDAQLLAPREGQFDLFYSRHGVMFFPDPVQAFSALREAANPHAALVFSCFQDWTANPWASELASAAADRTLPPPGREPSGFAFAEPAYVKGILGSSGWEATEPRPVSFDYVAGDTEEALSLLSAIGPASSVLRALPEEQRQAARQRMGGIVEAHFDGNAVTFPAAAWIWSSRAGAA